MSSKYAKGEEKKNSDKDTPTLQQNMTIMKIQNKGKTNLKWLQKILKRKNEKYRKGVEDT